MLRRVRNGNGFLDVDGARRFVESYMLRSLPASEVFNVLTGKREGSGRRKGVKQAHIEVMQQALWYLYFKTDTPSTVIGEAVDRSHHVVIKGARKVEDIRSLRAGYVDSDGLAATWERMERADLVKHFTRK